MRHAHALLGLSAALLVLAADASAQQSTVLFTLDDVQIQNQYGNTVAMTGAFEWSYTPGDFENGSGTFVELYIPGHGSDIATLDIVVEPGQLDFSLNINLHDHGLDVTVKLLQDLSLTQPALIDTTLSSYQYESGVVTNGTFASGQIVPHADVIHLCSGDDSGTSCPCGNASAGGEGCRNSTGVGARLWTAGSTSAAADDLAFQVAQGPASTPALLFAGTQAVNGGAGTAFGDGLRCAGGATQRLSVRFLDAAGAAAWPTGVVAQLGWGAGEQRVFQAWYRDVNGSPCGGQFNLSQAVAVTLQP